MTRDEFDKLKVGDWVRSKQGQVGVVIDIHRLSNAAYFSDGYIQCFNHYEDLTIINPPSLTTTQPPSDHYKRLGLEPWHIGAKWYTLEQLWCYFTLNAIAYLGRAPERGGYVENAKKAIQHLQEYVRLAEAQQDQPEGTL